MSKKTSELTGPALNWAVNHADGLTDMLAPVNYCGKWEFGGPIIEREAITVSQGSPVKGLEWMACDRGSTHIQHGPTYLIAAMRCYVASKLGDNIDIPEELTRE
jgi:hypothetical protein